MNDRRAVKSEFLRRITASSVAKRGLERRNDCKNGVSEGDYSPLGCYIIPRAKK